MSFTPTNLQEEINLAINKGKGGGLTTAQITAVLTAISTAQGTDTTTHDRTLQEPPKPLLPDMGN